MRILVYGFKHAGKTSIGKLLAKKLNMPFIDLDAELEKTYNKGKKKKLTFREIYKKEGATYFRRLERKLYKQLVKKSHFILAGVPVHTGVDISACDHRIFLDVPPQILLSRISKTGIPAFLKAHDLVDSFSKEYNARLPEYLRVFTMRIQNTQGKKRVVQEIRKKLQRPQLCVPIRAKNQEELIKQLNTLTDEVDYVELWLDRFEPDYEELLRHKKHPFIVVCKPKKEKGLFTGTQQERIKRLNKASHIATYVDADTATAKKLTPATNCGIISSYHNFTKTPSYSKLQTIVKNARGIPKVATYATSEQDNITLMRLLDGKQKIITAMGAKGKTSRILAPLFGGMLMFAPLKKQHATAPGQLTVREMRKLYEGIV
ncbi:MAG: type I 3-dehydroquinate dehydratase [Candidatus Woesearchaeota archaeon]|nr:type I 3-dehydroquinate dehydratase [Candidatus Woesearchaeota archaeon]